MKKIILLFIAVIALAGSGAVAQDVTAEQIVAKYVSLCADKGYVDTIRTTMITATVLAGPDTLSLVLFKDPGKLFYMKVTSKATGDNVRVYSNGVAVNIGNGTKEPITDPAELDEMNVQTYILPDIVYKKVGYKMNLEGTSKLDGVEYYIVKLQSPRGYVKFNYYDKESGLLRMIIDSKGVKSILSDYIKIKGGLYSKKNIVIYPEGGSVEIIVQDVVNNVTIDPALYKF